MRSVEPTDALRSIETALRLVIRDVLGDEGWLAAAGSPDRAPLEQKRTEENKRRDGAAVSSNLLDYTETYQLTNLVLKNWESFKPVFSDKARTESFLVSSRMCGIVLPIVVTSYLSSVTLSQASQDNCVIKCPCFGVP
jgi:hypothetical protein